MPARPSEPSLSTPSPAVKIALWLNVALWLLLLVTGVLLFFFYRPTAAAAYADLEASRSAVTFSVVLRHAHHLFSSLALLAVLAIPIAYVIDRRNRAALVSVFTVMTVVLASFSGSLLPWDQIALWAVATGDSLFGYRSVFRDDVRFVLLGGVEIGPDTLRRWLIVHVAVVPIALTAVASLAHRLARSAGQSKELHSPNA